MISLNLLQILSSICVIISGLFGFTRQAQMLQQNSYFAKRYFKWVLQSNITATLYSIAFTIVCAVSLLFEIDILLIIISAISLVRIKGQISLQKKSIKPLVFTARIKRMYFTLAVVFIALLVLGIYFESLIPIIVLFALSFVSVLSGFLVKALNHIPEKLIANSYVKSAKKILKSLNNMKVVGVTGSYGKTGTKFILARILSEKYNTVTTPESYNTPMGVVRTVRESLKNDTQVFVCEMGAKNVGDIDEICRIAHPTSAIITSIGPQHLETFKSIDNIIKTKFELADECIKNGGNVYVNGYNKYILDYITQNPNGSYRVYGTDKSFEYRAENISADRFGLKFDLVLKNERISVSAKLMGMFNVLNILAAASMAYDMGVDLKDIAYAISRLKPTEHRLELKGFINGSTLIDDAYNANPEGSIKAVEVLANFDGFKKIIVTPGLVELGDKEYECNYNLGLAACKECDIIIAVGKTRAVPFSAAVADSGFKKENFYITETFAEALGLLQNMTDSKTVVLFENDLPDNYKK